MSRVNYREALFRASSLLENHQINPRIAEWLLLHLLQESKAAFIPIMNEEFPQQQYIVYSEWLNRVLEGEPYQYIIGVEEFYGREFSVSPAVLIPRPETELLVENTLLYIDSLQQASDHSPLLGVDVGTGSGVIAISLALESKSIEMKAVDISIDALAVARKNAARYGASVTFAHSDVLTTLLSNNQKVDFIVSNPPYIPQSQKQMVDRNVVDYEPHLALFANENGYYFYRQIIEQSLQVLNSPGFIAFEIGINQENDILQLIHSLYPSAQCEVKKDYQGICRMIFAQV